MDPKNKGVQKVLEYNLARIFFDSKLNLPASVEHATNALKIDGSFFDASVLRVRTYCEMKRFPEAFAGCEFLLRSKISIDQQVFLDELIGDVEIAQKKDRGSTSYSFSVSDVEENKFFKERISMSKVKKEENQTIDMIIENAHQELARKQFKTAIALYSETIAQHPECADYLINRSICYLEMKNFHLAIADASKAIGIDSTYWKSYSQIVKCFLALGDINQAELYITKFDYDVPGAESIEIREKLAFKNLKNYDMKIKESFSEKDFVSCLNNIESALKIAYSSENYNEIKIECLIMVGQYEEADKLLESKLQLNSKDPNSIFLKGLNYYHQSELDLGILRFEEALRIDQDFKRAQEFRKYAKEMTKLKNDGKLMN